MGELSGHLVLAMTLAMSHQLSSLKPAMLASCAAAGPGADFTHFYRQQRVVPAAEFPRLLDALATPLPLVLRVSPRAPLAEKARHQLSSLLERDLLEERELLWAGGRVWQYRVDTTVRRDRGTGEQDYHRFLQRQQSRGALQRQESVSMIPALVLSPQRHHGVLDMCAAPGSKTCQLLEMMEAAEGGEGQGFVVANDASLARAISLNHRLQSTNVASPLTLVTSVDARWWPSLRGLAFDRILCDVPCSGDGTLRKRHANTPPWDVGVALALHETQVRLLRQGMRLLRPGGLLVYSTCSLNPLENEAVVAEALRQGRQWGADFEFVVDDPLAIATDLHGLHPMRGLSSWVPPLEAAPSSTRPPAAEEEWVRHALARTIRILPHRADCGGFFVAAIRRVGAAAPPARGEAAELDGSVPSEGDLVRLCRASDEWEAISSFFGVEGLEGSLLWAPDRAARRQKIYLASNGAAAALLNHWKPATRTRRLRLSGRLHHVGVKAFERLKLTNVKNRDTFGCQWRICQQALPYILPVLRKRVLYTSNKAVFGSVLREGLPTSTLQQLDSEGVVCGLSQCADPTGALLFGGAVFCLVAQHPQQADPPSDASSALASMACVLSPTCLTVWARKDEAQGILELLDL